MDPLYCSQEATADHAYMANKHKNPLKNAERLQQAAAKKAK